LSAPMRESSLCALVGWAEVKRRPNFSFLFFEKLNDSESCEICSKIIKYAKIMKLIL
jgi:hypothetical protein